MSYLDITGLTRFWNGIKQNFVTKQSIDNAGITNTTYTQKFGGEFSVTTVADEDHLKPYARASVTGRINKENMHRVTFNGIEYILPCRLWFEGNSGGFKVYEYLGNLSYYVSDISGVPGGTDNVPFLIVSDLNNSSSIDVFTSTAGTYTILVEQINYTKKQLPNTLIYGDNYAPITKHNNGGTYNGFSIGVNELKNKRGTAVIGYVNHISNEFSYIVGTNNNISSPYSLALGTYNTISSNNGGGIVIGSSSSVEGDAFDAIAIGEKTIANADYMLALGRSNCGANILDPPTFQPNTFYKKGDIASGKWMSQLSAIFTMMCAKDHTSANVTTFSEDKDENQKSYWMLTPSNGDTLLALGNGINNSRSNALKVDWTGNQYLNGTLYVNCESDSTGGIEVATKSDLSAVDLSARIAFGTGNGSIVAGDISNNLASGVYAWAEGNLSTASGPCSHAEGSQTTASGACSHAEGGNTQATQPNAHSEGGGTTASGACSHAEGSATTALGDISHAEGSGTVANHRAQHVFGEYNIPDHHSSLGTERGNYVEIVGNGTNLSSSNARTLDWNGNETLAGKLTVGATPTGSMDVATKGYVDTAYTQGIEVQVSGTSPVITADVNTRYICGEVTTISVTPPATGMCEVVFESGTTPAVLTLPATVMMPDWFEIESGRIYQISIENAKYGAVMSWLT